MDPSWYHHHHRPPPLPPGGAPPPLQGTICPVCSIYHFPFCPPSFLHNYPPSSHHHHQHPPPHPDQLYPRGPPQHSLVMAYDPFVDDLGGPGPSVDTHRPFLDSQRPPWSANSGFNRDANRVLYADDSYNNVGAKRMRFDNSGFSSVPAGTYANEHPPVNNSTDDDRRLKLIRDHGGAAGDEFDKYSGRKISFDEVDDMGWKPKIGLFTKSSDFDRKGILVQENNVQKNEEWKFGQPYNPLDYRLHQTNAYEHGRHSFNSVEQPRQNNEAMRHNWQGFSGSSAIYNDRTSGFGRGFHSPDNHLVSKNAMQHVMELKPNQFGLPYLNNQQPPLPVTPPPPLPKESPGQCLLEPVFSSSPSVSSASLFPILPSSPAVVPSPYPPVPEYHSNKGLHSSSGFVSEEQLPYRTYFAGSEVVAQRSLSPDKPEVIDGSHILKHPHRTTRPDHIVIILRGLPGSGKSYLAKMLRDLEVENGGNVPRIHSMDDYFMSEVEKVEESEVPKTSGTVRGKKAVTKKVMEYSYEPEMEEAYRSSMLKAFKKTLDDGVFNFVIVDDRNLRVADFAQFWATAKRSGYEVYLLEATYKDPVGCAARNVHGFILDDIQKMADLWEEAPSVYMKLDIKSLLNGDGLEQNGIQEVDMDMEDGDPVCGDSATEESNVEKLVLPPVEVLVSDAMLKEGRRWESDADHLSEEVKELGKSKWSNDLDEDDIRDNVTGGNITAVSGLIQSHNKEGKSVRWGDQVLNSGFSIGGAKTANVASLVIGPGAGYNLKSNPLSDEEKIRSSGNEMKRQDAFQERLRAERESFKAVFDKRRQRISGFSSED